MARVVVALSVLALMLAGCGDDGGGEKSASTPAPKSDAIYTLMWSVAADEFDEQEATLDEILASWRWT